MANGQYWRVKARFFVQEHPKVDKEEMIRVITFLMIDLNNSRS
jgi:hypothetical protein